MVQTDIINALNDLYINRRNRYLKQVNGQTYTVTAGKRMKSKKGNTFKVRPLVDSMLADHLKGKASYGVFSTHETKFILFDFDFKDDFNACKQHYYKVYFALNELGIKDDWIYTTFSGGKGLHITLYMDEPIKVVDAERFYKTVLERAELSDMARNIEYRPKATQGVKLPLGRHYKTGKQVCFVENMNVENELPPETILTVNKTPLKAIYSTLETLNDDCSALTDEQVVECTQTEILPNIKPLKVYELNSDADFTADYYNELLVNGLKAKGTRHKVTYRLILFLKTHYGFDEEETRYHILQWLEKQDTSYYDTPLDDAIAETLEMVEHIYLNNQSLTIAKKELILTIDELRTILTATKSDGKHFTLKQKTVLFALLMHAKRYTSDNNGTFYMTYDQITAVTGYAKRKGIYELLNEFEKYGYIAIHSRNERIEGTCKKSPNIYEVLFMAKEKATTAECSDVLKVSDYDGTTFMRLVNEHFESSQLRRLLPRRQAEHFIIA